MNFLGECEGTPATFNQPEELYAQLSTSTTFNSYVFGAGPTAMQAFTELTTTGASNGISMTAPPAPAGSIFTVDQAMENMRASICVTARITAGGGSDRDIEMGVFINGFQVGSGIISTVKGTGYSRFFIHVITGPVPAGTTIEIKIANLLGNAMTLEISRSVFAINGPKSF